MSFRFGESKAIAVLFGETAMPIPPARSKWNKAGDPPPGWWNESRRPHGEHLARHQIDALVKAAGIAGRHGARDAAIIWTSFVHGLRVCEAAALLIEQYDFRDKSVRMMRAKRGSNKMLHPVEKREAKAILELIGDRRQGHIFVNERGNAFDVSSLKKIVARAGREATDRDGAPYFNFPVHFHMLRHACGFWLNEQGYGVRMIQDWLGHKNIRHTELYTANSPEAAKRVRFD
jgi:type 1 fimbriae regulatory protein FimB/type 1 fimbriae regulatory protein FimE